MKTYIGIDPGKSGSIATICGESVGTVRLSETEADISDWLRSVVDGECFAILEQVGAMPKQGVVSTFKFGQSFGFLRGLLIAHRVPFEMVTPAKWQGEMRCRSKGDKNVTKAKAQELFPGEKIVHATADALLLAEYCRRTKSQ